LIVTSFARAVREIEHTTIPLKDGTRLAARIWLPEDAETDLVPALLEYLPYRKHDGTHERDALTHPYLAGHGYAAVRVDIRGSGESDGVLEDEYSQPELDDALEVIAWLASQPWCSGAVGMFGISWGGFNALQLAALRPPALKAIVTLCSTDDRYADDVHYMGGAKLASADLGWGGFFFADMCHPPDPLLVGERWREMWLQRLENMPLFLERWLKHQRRDGYWRRDSVAIFVVGCATLSKLRACSSGGTYRRIRSARTTSCRGIVRGRTSCDARNGTSGHARRATCCGGRPFPRPRRARCSRP
jgi:predicted acyl esterase